jgi:diguanylate cyclase (GGDEF)-like protein
MNIMIKTRIITGLTLSMLLLLVLASGSYGYVRDVLYSVDELVEESTEELLPVARLQNIILRSENAINDFIINGGDVDKMNYLALSVELSLAFDSALKGKFGESEQALIRKAKTEWDTANAISQKILALEAAAGITEYKEPMKLFDRHIQIAALIVEKLLTEIIHETQEHASDAHNVLKELIPMVALTLVIGLILALYMSHFTLYSILKPIGSLLDGANRFAVGELDYQVRIGANDEIGELTAAFNQMAAKLATFTTRDELTGFYNRRFMKRVLTEELGRSQRHRHNLGLLMIDVDHFKSINDNYGHITGDQALSELGKIIVTSLREEDVVCRYGGEELVVILPEVDGVDSVMQTAERLRSAVESRSFKNSKGTSITMTVSIGASVFPHHGEDEVELFKQADQALYRAKDAGRNRSVLA